MLSVVQTSYQLPITPEKLFPPPSTLLWSVHFTISATLSTPSQWNRSSPLPLCQQALPLADSSLHGLPKQILGLV